jgi:hypothetical protein
MCEARNRRTNSPEQIIHLLPFTALRQWRDNYSGCGILRPGFIAGIGPRKAIKGHGEVPDECKQRVLALSASKAKAKARRTQDVGRRIAGAVTSRADGIALRSTEVAS